jgi:3-oxoacyl-[acyl-carrier-protein] synthase III
MNRAAILGVGVHLPEKVRTNDHWGPEIVARWSQNRAQKITEKRETKELTKGQELIAKAMAELRSDPYVGAKCRRVLAPELESSDMELAAAKEALERSGTDPEEIDLLMVYSLVADKLAVPNAYLVHQKLGLGGQCVTMQVDAACNSFLVPLGAAERMILGGGARKALLVQSCCISRIGRPEEPSSAWFGDGATALVVGASHDGSGIVSRVHRTDSSLYRAFTMGVAGSRSWYDEGRVWLQLEDPEVARKIVYGSADALREVALAALDAAGMKPKDVDFYGAHPATPFSVRTSREFIGLEDAATVDTFPLVGNLGAANIPLVLAMGEREGLLRKGSRVLMAGGGAGGSWSSVVMNW